jgi:glycosyltransferase involved in cell wall biosynthesis
MAAVPAAGCAPVLWPPTLRLLGGGSLNVVLVSSAGVCGIYEYSQILLDGFVAAGHRGRYLGVRNWDNADLHRQLRSIAPEDDVVMFEYEPGIFHLWALVRAMAYVRLVRRKKVILSVHEIEPAKFSHLHNIQGRLNQPARFGLLGELVRVPFATLDVALHYYVMRLGWTWLGWLPNLIVAHSPRGQANVGLITANRAKVTSIPLAIKAQDGNSTALRTELGLPQDRFLFICPGFLFRRKRLVETIEQLPDGADLLIVGLPSEFDPGYLEEIQAALKKWPKKRVRLIHDYERMEQYLLASDVVVMYYEDVYQSAVAPLALGAGKPCIWSDLPAFADFEGAGLFVQTPADLHQAMIEIQRPEVLLPLQAGAVRLRETFSPARLAQAHLDALTAPR